MKDIWVYVTERRSECDALGLDTEWTILNPIDDRGATTTGMIEAKIEIGDDAYVQAFERVQLNEDSITRLRFSYFLIVDGTEVGGFERDPSHVPAEHMHCGEDHERHTASAPSFKESMYRALEHYARHASGDGDDCDPSDYE